MASFLERLREKNKNSKHVGVPPVTNPKLPTKVERDTAAFSTRQKEMPNFTFGTGTPLENLRARMAAASHPTPTRPDPAFKPGASAGTSKESNADMTTFDADFQKYMAGLRANMKAKANEETKDNTK